MKEAHAAAISAHFGRGGALSLRVCARSSLCEGSWRRSQHSNLTEASERPRCRPRPGPSCTATPPETGASNPRTQKRPSPKSGPADEASEEAMHLDIQKLQEKRDMLDKELSQLMSEGYSVDELEDHISQLHEYNDIKDVGQMLLGRLAVIRGVTTKELYPEFGLDMND